MERIGARPGLVEGTSSNLKITTAQDLVIAEGIMKHRLAHGASGTGQA